MAELVYTQGFVEDAAHIRSADKRDYVLSATEALCLFPEMGSADVPRSIRSRHGAGVRKLSVRPFIIVYEYVPDSDEVYLLGIDHQRNVT